MKKIKNRLCSSKGETLAEVLISLLIIGMSTMMLAGMINTAGQLSARTNERDTDFLNALNDIEGKGSEGSWKEETVTITDTERPGSPIPIQVKLYDNDRLKAYIPKSGSTGETGSGGESDLNKSSETP